MGSRSLIQLLIVVQQLVAGKVSQAFNDYKPGAVVVSLLVQKCFELEWTSCRETAWRKSLWLPPLHIRSVSVALSVFLFSLYSQRMEGWLQCCCCCVSDCMIELMKKFMTSDCVPRSIFQKDVLTFNTCKYRLFNDHSVSFLNLSLMRRHS